MFPFIFSKDFFFFFLLGFLGFLEIFFGFISLSHPDNAFEVSVLVTPLHIVPEWYFLEFYAILKAIPNKNAGFMIMFSSIFCVFIFGEHKGLSRLVLSHIFTGHFSVSFFFPVYTSFMWLSALWFLESLVAFLQPLARLAFLFTSLHKIYISLLPSCTGILLKQFGSSSSFSSILFLCCRNKRRVHAFSILCGVTPFMQDGTYPTRNFATLGPFLTYSRR